MYGCLGFQSSCITYFINVSWFQIALNQEHKYMLSFAPDYDHLPLIAKVEVFEYALQNTEGNDLARVCIHLKYLLLLLLCISCYCSAVIMQFQAALNWLLTGSLVEKSHF